MSRWVHTEELGPNDCQLRQCLEKDREITGLLAVVYYEGYPINMHSSCAKAFLKEVRLEEIQELNQRFARWN